MNKKDLRVKYKGKRELLSLEEVESLSERIAENFLKNIDLSAVKSIHIFLPIKNKKEINTQLLIERIKFKYPSLQIIVPKMEGDQLQSYLIGAKTTFEINSLGIPEPVNAALYPSYELDLVIMPLLVFDDYGNRVGYGKGFYDRFLTTCRKEIIKVGLSFFESEPVIAADPYDVPMNYCVTPTKFYSFQ